jgi:hypothetical protein
MLAATRTVPLSVAMAVRPSLSRPSTTPLMMVPGSTWRKPRGGSATVPNTEVVVTVPEGPMKRPPNGLRMSLM